jgi:hypothetical protein
LTRTFEAASTVVGSTYPLRGALTFKEVGDAAEFLGELRVCTLLASDLDWDWVAERSADVAEAIDIFVDAVASQEGTGLDGSWISLHFGSPGSGFTLATRGGLKYGMVSAAALETDETLGRHALTEVEPNA